MTSRTAPVSGLQRGLWFMDRWNPGSVAYTIPWEFRFDGPVDADALQRSLLAIVRRHEALRTTFGLGPDGPEQTVHAEARIELERVRPTVRTRWPRRSPSGSASVSTLPPGRCCARCWSVTGRC